MLTRLVKLIRLPVTGAAFAQVWQALGSFMLQVLAARTLGAAGLGVVSLSLGVTVLATALASGAVGDSLVILDRHNLRVRGGLEGWAILLCLVSMLVTGIAMAALGVLQPVDALLFALALGAFQLEELVRRILMATMRFWRLAAADTVALLVALATIGCWMLVAPIQIGVFFLALLLGQVAGLVAGLLMVPAKERVLVPVTRPGLASVAGFGLMRGVQVSVPQAVLTAARTIVVILAGQAALGQVEAARIFVAPVTLTVQGIGSYLLSSYVKDRRIAVADLAARARRSSLLLIAAAVVAGLALTASAPYLAHYLTGPNVVVDRVAVAGWALYVASSASLQPFASLAAVLGKQPVVLACRGMDATFAVGLLWILLGPLSLSASLTPFALATGLFVGGVLVRQFALKPLINPVPGSSAGNLTARTSNALT